jgi:hypothetical protein
MAVLWSIKSKQALALNYLATTELILQRKVAATGRMIRIATYDDVSYNRNGTFKPSF